MEALPRRRDVGAGGSVSDLTGSWSGEDGWEGETSDEWAPAASDTEEERGNGYWRSGLGRGPGRKARAGFAGPAGNRLTGRNRGKKRTGKNFIFLFKI
jgi:hypothetical protein